MPKPQYRRIRSTDDAQTQPHLVFLMGAGMGGGVTLLFAVLCIIIPSIFSFFKGVLAFCAVFTAAATVATIIAWRRREIVATLDVPPMKDSARRAAKEIKRLINDKQISDVLKLSNETRYGTEMPEIHVWLNERLTEGWVAIENIANWERADRERFEQRVSGILSGKYQRFAVTSSELTAGDSYILFHFEDSLTSQRLIVKKSFVRFKSSDSHAIRLSKDLVWHSDIAPHMSIIARTRSGKSVLAGRYMARVMLLQGWEVEYNSAKYDQYVKTYGGQYDPIKIVERAEYWCHVMDERLARINDAGKDKYLDMEDMPDIGLFFDELGNLNASLETMDKIDKTLKLGTRWTTAINRLSATGGSAGIHIIAISQFATKEGFLPSLARVNCSDAVIMLGGAADSADERKYLMSGFADMPKRSYGKGQGVARILGSGKKWEVPHFYETPWFED